jgi:hypothetical protein
MTDFSRAEILNEVSQIFQAVLDVGRDGGTLNTEEEYAGLLELSSLTLILHNDGAFYLSRLAANKLASLVSKEIDLVEDMLVALDDLGQVGDAVTDTTILNNAITALLNLDAATSVQGRPETTRFSNLMDQFAGELRPNVVSTSGNLVRPREDARNVLRVDFTRLETIHDRILVAVDALLSLLDSFVALDLPSKAASTAFARIRSNLQEVNDFLETATEAENIAQSRQNLLTALASKAAVDIIATFSDPRGLKYRSPLDPIPAGTTNLGRVTGEGEAAFLLTSPGPWQLPISSDLVLAVDGGAGQTVVLSTILGAVLNGRNQETFEVTAADQNLHAIVDPNVYDFTVSSLTTTVATLTEYVRLGFKHLGAPVSFTGWSTTPFFDSDTYLRTIVELRTLQTFTSLTWNAGPSTVDLSGQAGGDEAAGLNSGHVGAYILDSSGNRFEITDVIDSNTAEIDARGLSPGTGVGSLHGSLSAGSGDTKFTFSAALNAGNLSAASVSVGPTVKTAELTIGSRTAAQVVSDIGLEAGSFDAGHIGAPLNQHIQPLVVSGDSTRVALSIRSKLNSYLQITRQFTRPKLTPAASILVEDSAHTLLGFVEGEADTTDVLTVSELVNAINDVVIGATAEVEETVLLEGSVLSTAKDSAVITDTTQDFSALGIQVGDQVNILEGDASGISQILSVGTTTLTLDRADFVSSESDLTYVLFRQQVKVSSNKTTRGSSVQALSSPSEFLLPADKQFGSISQFEAVTRTGEALTFQGVVSGDLLRIVGDKETFPVLEINDTVLVLESGLPSNTEGVGFEIRSEAAGLYDQLTEDLTTYTTSASLLPNHGYDENLDEIDAALTSAILPGQKFVAARNRARQLLADLLSILTANPRRPDDYTAEVPQAVLNLEDMLAVFVVDPVVAIDKLLNAFLDRKYDRAADLLQAGRLEELFDTNEETGSYSGAVMSNSRVVSRDLPEVPSDAASVDDELNVAVSANSGLPDPEKNFSDFEINDENEVVE